jgi:secondary thiamine-phosphate synthase enzyme|tara:strand:- start:4503 stop:4904 length:402 start_codon:yes stop_codon:yes gene_type:complete
MITFTVTTHKRTDFIDITGQVQDEVSKSGVESGIITIYVPHTTCGVIINENADPHVVDDIQMQLEKLVPFEAGYKHREQNSDSHIKVAMTGSSETVIIENGQLVLGTWQGIMLCDFDGPRTRKVYLKILSGST